MKRAANLTVDETLLAQAKSLNLNLSQIPETSLREAVSDGKAARWRKENAAQSLGWRSFRRSSRDKDVS